MYKYWKKNKRQIQQTIIHLNRFHIGALRKRQKLNELSLDNIYSKLILPLWTSLAEVEFHLLITQHEQLTKPFLDKVDLSNKPETDRWLALVEYFFKDKYLNNQKRELNKLNLGVTHYHRYETLIKIISEDLKPFVELRNRLAHGQWAVAFNSVGGAKNQKFTTQAWILSKKDMILLKAFVTNLPPLVELLMTSKKTFERDYDKYVHRILLAKKDVDLRFAFILSHGSH